MFFLFPIFDAMTKGHIIRRCVAVFLRVLGVLAPLFGLLTAGGTLYAVSQVPEGVDGRGGMYLAAILVALIVLASQVCIGQLCFYRARSVEAIADGDYTVVPILSVVFRALGESFAIACAAFGLSGCLAIWISGAEVGRVLPMASGFMMGNSFLSGLGCLLGMAIVAFGSVILFYFLAEISLVLVDMAQNLRAMREKP